MPKFISRREFIEKGAKGAVAAAALPYFLKISNHIDPFGINRAENLGLNDYYERFGVNESIINEVIAEALSRGGDYCDLFFQHNISNFIGLEDDLINRAYSSVDFGVGIRVLKGDQTGYSFTEEITLKSMKLAAQTAANIADSGKKGNIAKLKLLKAPNYYIVEKPWEEISIDQKIPFLHKANELMKSKEASLIKTTASFNNETSYILIATSDGKVAFDCQPMGVFSVGCAAEKNGRKEQSYSSISKRSGLEIINDQTLAKLTAEAVDKTMILFEAVKPEAGEMEVVLAAGGSGILLHEAIGHGMEADFNRKGISIFSDKIDKKVAESFVSIVDDGTNPNVRGSINFDDEANETQKTYLVENGVLRSYMHDKISAEHYKLKPTGNGRRESFRYEPQARMRNTYMLPGPHKKDEIIASVKKGIYCESFTNGQVFIGAGDYTFYVANGYMIEDGKITRPIKDVNVIGNGPQTLKDIVMVADDFQMDEGGWSCGKGGQSVPVSLGLPTVKVSKITVGGVNA